jgi:hypothetical protein
VSGSSTGAKVAYKPFGIVAGILGGLLASAVVKRVWRAVRGDDEVPSSTDRERGWKEVLPAAALEGAVFAAVKAAVDRGGAVAFQRMTGAWPGD